MEGSQRGNRGNYGNQDNHGRDGGREEGRDEGREWGREGGRDRGRGVQDQCMYFVQGKCRFGRHCRFSHEGFTRAIMVRHAESEFNRDAHHNRDILYCEKPLTKVHLN